MNKVLLVNCPHCELNFSYYESEWRPFCSERCKMVDLGQWFEESYRVPVKDSIPTISQGNQTDLDSTEDSDEFIPNDESEYE